MVVADGDIKHLMLPMVENLFIKSVLAEKENKEILYKEYQEMAKLVVIKQFNKNLIKKTLQN